MLAALYALCVVGPALSLALADGAAAAHCFTDDHHMVAAMHVHADGALHDHAKHASDHEHGAQHAQPPADAPADTSKNTGDGKCCGLFCVTAASQAVSAEVVGVAPRVSLMALALEAAVHGHDPARIDRPPDTLASF